MSDATIFEKHYKAGFPDGWDKDIPRFTPSDWRELIVLAVKLEWLTIFHHYLSPADQSDAPEPIRQQIREEYKTIHASIAPEFWQNLRTMKRDPHRLENPDFSPELYIARKSIGVPLGMSITSAGGADTTFELVFATYTGGTGPKRRQNILAGLRQAILAYDGKNYTADIFTGLLELAGRLEGYSDGPLFGASDMEHIRTAIRAAPFRPGDEHSLISHMRGLARRSAPAT